MTINRTSRFDIRNALTFAQLSAAAYSATPTIYCAQTDTAVVITETETDFIIAFPGTRDLRDVLKDADCKRIARAFLGFKWVHEGFCKAFESVADQIGDQVLRRLPTKQSWIIGHSKGGAMATICAAYLAIRDYPIAGVYTFGEPRSGSATWAAFCDEKFGPVHFRLEDELDPITRVPGLIAGYRHSGQLEFMSSLGGVKENPTLIMKVFSDAFECWLAKRKGPEAIAALAEDHKISNYIARLQSIALNQTPKPACSGVPALPIT